MQVKKPKRGYKVVGIKAQDTELYEEIPEEWNLTGEELLDNSTQRKDLVQGNNF